MLSLGTHQHIPFCYEVLGFATLLDHISFSVHKRIALLLHQKFLLDCSFVLYIRRADLLTRRIAALTV
jgi:hypothetical protein